MCAHIEAALGGYQRDALVTYGMGGCCDGGGGGGGGGGYGGW